MGSGPEAPSELFRDWQRTQTQSSATADDRLKAANGCPVLREAGTTAVRHQASCESCFPFLARSSAARVRRRVFSLDNRLTWMSANWTLLSRLPLIREHCGTQVQKQRHLIVGNSL